MIPARFTPLPETPTVDVVGYRRFTPAAAVVHKTWKGTHSHGPGEPCEDCDDLLDTDP